jgi:methyl-accepting chemotaxis protein
MDWFGRSIANKLMATIVLGALVVVAATLYSSIQARSDIESFDRVIKVDLDNERRIQVMLSNFKTQVQEWKNTLIRGHDDSNRTKYWGRFQQVENRIQKEGEDLIDSLNNEESKRLIQKFLLEHQIMGQAYRKGFSAFENSGYDHIAGDNAVKGIDRAPTKLLTSAAELIAEEASRESAVVSETAYSQNFLMLIIVMLAIIAYIILSIVLVNRAVVLPSRQLIKIIANISKGRLSDEITITRRDELGQLADASRELQSFLKNLAQQLSATNSHLLSASSALNDATDGVKGRVDAAHDTTEHVASAMAEMSATSQEVASHAAEAASAAKEADHAASESASTMQSAQASVNRLSEQVGLTVETVKKLAEDTNEVGTVLSVIRGIAEQTNLLALNAAIEAARAGEQGRGFAVVADEVRTLAQKTQQSTEEIEGIIHNVQNGAKETVSVMDASYETTNQSASLFKDATEKLGVVTHSVERITDLSHQVATAAEEQTNVAEDITRTIVQVSDLVEETVGSVAATRTTALELSDMAGQTDELAKRFTL